MPSWLNPDADTRGAAYHAAQSMIGPLGSLTTVTGAFSLALKGINERLDETKQRADALRDELTAMGWTVEDTAAGTAVRR